MFRGINRQRIFEDSADYGYFLECLSRALRLSNAKILAYALMTNHIHLLMEVGTEPLATTLKRVMVRYVGWYNRKYDRVGHLFQDRYASRPVCDDAYFLMVLMYIHFNPVVAGLCRAPADYPWSSRRTLGRPGSLVDLTRVESLLPLESLLRAEARYEPSQAASLDVLAYDDESEYRTDAQAMGLLFQVSGATTGPDFQRLPVESQMAAVRAASVGGLSVRQLSRLTGLGRNLVFMWARRV
jgi:REP element-mobilizing transposase RayT